MKMRKYLAFAVVALLAMAMIMTSCSKGEFGSGEDITDKHVSITASNAGEKTSIVTGSLIVEDGEQIMITSALESGSVQFDFITGDGSDVVTDPENVDAVLSAAVGAGETLPCEIEPGEYMVMATVMEKATGDISVDVVAKEEEDVAAGWTEAASTDEAAEKAGLDLFIVDPEGLSLGDVLEAKYSYKEGVAQANYSIAAVEMFVKKGLSSIDEGDISEDTNEYKHEWTQNIKGLEVKCFGNREGEATKTIWTSGDYSYAILAYGAGGDDDFGLNADDVSSLVNSIQ